MTQTTGRLFDELAKVMTNAAGAAQGLRGEVDGVIKAQLEKFLSDMDLVQREEFDAVKTMAQIARTENEDLKAKIEALEARLARLDSLT